MFIYLCPHNFKLYLKMTLTLLKLVVYKLKQNFIVLVFTTTLIKG